jgi:hypothetical protein
MGSGPTLLITQNRPFWHVLSKVGVQSKFPHFICSVTSHGFVL